MSRWGKYDNWHQWRWNQIEQGCFFYFNNFPKYSLKETARIFRISEAGMAKGWTSFKYEMGIKGVSRYPAMMEIKCEDRATIG